MFILVVLVSGLSAVAAYFVPHPSEKVQSNNCASLKNGENYTIGTNLVQAGALSIQNLTGVNNATFCRVLGQIPYGNNNTINFEVWLPETSEYNGRYLSVGNGGFAGSIDYNSMLTNLQAGFAVGGCDGGHQESENGNNTLGTSVPFMRSRAEVLAWLRDSIATFTVPAKAITTSFYHCAPKKMYYAGCSTGGAQGYALANFYPDIFDGIYAGSAGNWYSHLMLSFLWNGLSSERPGAFLTQETLDFVRDVVVRSCDAIDGVEDGVIDDPTKCDFDITSLLCKQEQAQVNSTGIVCLNQTQLQTVKDLYAGPGQDIYPGFAPGSESEWLQQETELYKSYAAPLLQNLVYHNLSYDYQTFNFASDVKTVDDVAGPLIDATSPRLDAFKARGGKLIASQGWADPFNAPFWPIQQHDQAKLIYGQVGLNDFWRLFMVPGGGHCGAATTYPLAPSTLHPLEGLIPWVEDGIAPRYVLATDPADGSNTTKKLCPYPQQAVYEGKAINDHRSYTCV